MPGPRLFDFRDDNDPVAEFGLQEYLRSLGRLLAVPPSLIPDLPGNCSDTSRDQPSALNSTTRTGCSYWPVSMSVITVCRSAVVSLVYR
jgi:hypothetical protein